VTPLTFALLGDPVAHSLSPTMHAAAYRALGLPHRYEALRCSAAELGPLVAELRGGRYAGFNVTVPHKRRVLEHVDAVDESAALAGAANTLVLREGRVVAHNTDAPALAAELEALRPRKAARALVLGAGGGARSAVLALVTRLGASHVAVRARPAADAGARSAFVSELRRAAEKSGSSAELVLEPWSAAPERERDTAIVVQATSAGMSGAAPGEAVASVVSWHDLPPDAVVLDLVYAPRETPFLAAARARGLAAESGLGMLARQGALAFELWLGVPAPLEAMRAAL
jgi:shikimate dehydrogenase